MSIVTFDLGLGNRLETVPAWPEGPWKGSDFRPYYSATRPQIAHLIDYAKAIATLENLDEEDSTQLVDWASEFFLIDAYRKPIAWRPFAAMAAHRICYEHSSVYLHGPNFRTEDARIVATKAYQDESKRRIAKLTT